MKRGFARPTAEKAPVIKPENIVLPTPLSIPPPEGKPVWIIVVGVLVIGLLIGMVFKPSASRTSRVSSTPNRAPASDSHHSDSVVLAPASLPVTATKFA